MHRRGFLKATTGMAVLGLAFPSTLKAQGLDRISVSAMRGSIDATELGARPDALDDQSLAFARMLKAASARDMPVFLPPGRYVVSNLALPKRVRLSGVPGATRIVYGGEGHLFRSEDADLIDLSGLMIDGANHWLDERVDGLFDARRTDQLVIDNCTIVGSSKHGIALEHTTGRIERSAISGAADAGIYSVEGAGLEISGNHVSDCANGGILVHRWTAAADATMVTANRIESIGAKGGGTGQNGNGINIFRANNVIVSGNSVDACAFSAIRANSASDIQIAGNTCRRSGETAIYSEFAFEGALINANIIDGAANGIAIVNFNKGGRLGVCSANVVRNLSETGPYPADAPGFGIGINVEADCSVTGNVVENAPLFGINIGWGAYMRNVVATGNMIRKCQTGVAVSVVKGTGSAVISDNVIEDAPKGAVVGYRWQEPATGDLARERGSGYANLSVERNQVS